MAPRAPGEHGVKRSSTITLGSARDGPLTYKKKVLENKKIYMNKHKNYIEASDKEIFL